MTKGVVLFAFNSSKTDYYRMAEFTAKRVHHFLDLPVTLITDKNSIPQNHAPIFDHVIMIEPDRGNTKEKNVWINKGRYLAYTLSPYDHTLLLDVDYLINSSKLNLLFELDTDFCCHDKMDILMYSGSTQEKLSRLSYDTLWATVVVFSKTARAKHIFECMKMIQDNYSHYSALHHFVAGSFRNDYALTLALRIANGHLDTGHDFIPWNLLHTDRRIKIYPVTEHPMNTQYVLTTATTKRNKTRTEYITISDLDFHVMDKDNFEDLMP